MTSVTPAQRAAPQMTHTPDPVTAPQAQAVVDAVEARPAKPRLRDQLADNPLLSLIGGAVVVLLTILGTLVVALLVFTLTSINDRIDSLGERIDRLDVSLNDRIDRLDVSLNDRIDRLDVSLNDRIDRLDVSLNDRIDRLEDKVDAGFAAQGAQIAELDRKLTALIAHLNATEAVDAALEHRLLIPGASARGAAGEPPG